MYDAERFELGFLVAKNLPSCNVLVYDGLCSMVSEVVEEVRTHVGQQCATHLLSDTFTMKRD